MQNSFPIPDLLEAYMLSKKSLCGLAIAAGVVLVSNSTLLAQPASQSPPYLDPKLTVGERVDDLLGRMTLKEKVGQLNLPCVYARGLGGGLSAKMEGCRKFTEGTLTTEIGPACETGIIPPSTEALAAELAEWCDFFERLQLMLRLAPMLRKRYED